MSSGWLLHGPRSAFEDSLLVVGEGHRLTDAEAGLSECVACDGGCQVSEVAGWSVWLTREALGVLQVTARAPRWRVGKWSL